MYLKRYVAYQSLIILKTFWIPLEHARNMLGEITNNMKCVYRVGEMFEGDLGNSHIESLAT